MEFPHAGRQSCPALCPDSGTVRQVPLGPQSYAKNPPSPFLREVPVTWDDILFADGYSARFVCLARRKGSNGLLPESMRAGLVTLLFLLIFPNREAIL